MKSDVLVAPHHGSKTSSSLRFIKQVNPDLVVFSTGFQNKFRFPSSKVVRRYRSLGIKMLNTADFGGINIHEL